MFVNSPGCFLSNVSVLFHLCEESFSFASSVLATLWCHQVTVGHQVHMGQTSHSLPIFPCHLVDL